MSGSQKKPVADESKSGGRGASTANESDQRASSSRQEIDSLYEREKLPRDSSINDQLLASERAASILASCIKPNDKRPGKLHSTTNFLVMCF